MDFAHFQSVQDAMQQESQEQATVFSAEALLVARMCAMLARNSTSGVDAARRIEAEFLGDRFELAPPDPEEKRQSKIDALVERYATRIWDRHPKVRRCGIKEVQTKLRGILRYKKAGGKAAEMLLEQIDKNHASWCRSEKWTKENGEFATGLANWLASSVERYMEPCPEDDTPDLGDLPEWKPAW